MKQVPGTCFILSFYFLQVRGVNALAPQIQRVAAITQSFFCCFIVDSFLVYYTIL